MTMYIQTAPPARVPQALSLSHRGVPYELVILHACSRQILRAAAGKVAIYRRQHCHDVYHLVLYIQGRNRFLLQGEPRAARPGAIVFTGPGDHHSFGPHDAGQVSYMEVSFALRSRQGDLALAPHELLGLYVGATLPPIAMPVQLEATAARAFRAGITLLVARLTRPGRMARFAAYRTLLDLLALLVDEVYGKGVAPEPSAPPPLARARREIDLRFAETLRIADLATAAHLSPGYFMRAFKARYGASPIRYQQELRISAAKNLLANTNLLCKEIAARTGFEDTYYFSKVFKKLTGMSPTRFRNNGS